MGFQESISKVFYGVGAFFAALTVLYFGSEYILEFSPITKSLLLFSTFLVFLILGLRLSSKGSIRFSYLSVGLGIISFLSFTVYTAGKFDFSSDQIFLLLLASALAFTGLGYLFREEKLEVVVKGSGKVLLGVAIFTVALSAADYLGEKPSYDVSFEEQVEVSPGEEAVLGQLRISNSFFLPRDIKTPSYSVCLEQNETVYDRGLMYEESIDDVLKGGETLSTDLIYRSPPPHYENVSGVFDVEEADECPSSLEEGIIYVFESNGYSGSVLRER